MSMIMNHDMTAMLGHRIMQKHSLAMRRSLQKLSSGLRKQIADVDNTADLAISETMRSRIGGMEKALNNTQDGISMIQTATGALEHTHGILMRMRELSVQAANDTLTQQDRSYIQVEMNELRKEIDRIGNSTQFNRKNILSGDNAVLWSSSDDKVKAIVNGGLRSIDNYGQKYAVDGNYRINVKADAGKAQVQKSGIFRVRRDDVISGKITNEALGVNDVSAEGIPAGKYSINLSEAEAGTEGILTGYYGLGGTVSSTDTEITFQDGIGAPVNKITISTDDGVEIWSASGADLFGFAESGGITTAADQSAFFEGRRNAENGKFFLGMKNEVIAAAREKGITITGFGDTDSESGAFTLNAQTTDGKAPGLKITYDTAETGATPVTSITENESTVMSADTVFSVNVADQNMDNASILFEVKAIDAVSNTVTLSAKASILSQDGLSSSAVQDNIILSMGPDGNTPNTVNLSKLFGGTIDDQSVTISLGENGVTPIEKDAKFVYSVKAGAPDNGNENPIQLNISTVADTSDPEHWLGGAFKGNSVQYFLNGDDVHGKELDFGQFFVNSDTGAVSHGTITLETNSLFRSSASGGELDPASNSFVASLDVEHAGKIADGGTTLRDIENFWTDDGVFILEQPKELTLTQGDGTQARITVYGGDTINDLTRKLNDAVANGLGQGRYVDETGKFASFVDAGTQAFESVEGTIVIRSVLAGSKGEITLSGNEDLLNALAINTIQASEETKYEVSIMDAHEGFSIAQNVKVTGNSMVGVIHKNIDVEFDPMLGVNVAWNESTNNFDLDSIAKNTGIDVVLHLADNTTIFQTGGTEGDDVMLAIGDMRAHALGLDGVNVMSRERSSISIGLIDDAIDKVSMQMAKLGSAQNRLEHHANSLADETDALVEANTRIRDVDYMTEIMNFTKTKILMDSNAAMLAQANQIQSTTILTLLRQ